MSYVSKNDLESGALQSDSVKGDTRKIGSLHQYFEHLSQPLLIALSYLSILLLGLCDYITGYEVSFAVFYLVPVSFIAWYGSFRAAMISSAISALTWTAANYLAGERLEHPAIYIWNTSTRLVFFYVVAILISRMKLSLETERVISRSDYLTKILNRRAFHEAAAMEMKRA